MSSTKYILGLFDDPDDMMHGIDALQKNSVPIYDVYTPMPIHGIEAKLGVKDSRLGYAAFMFGCLGRYDDFQHGIFHAGTRLADEHRW